MRNYETIEVYDTKLVAKNKHVADPLLEEARTLWRRWIDTPLCGGAIRISNRSFAAVYVYRGGERRRMDKK